MAKYYTFTGGSNNMTKVVYKTGPFCKKRGTELVNITSSPCARGGGSMAKYCTIIGGRGLE